jgi:aminopeptidase N
MRWRVRVDEKARVLDGEARYELDAGGVVDLDARGQALVEARGPDGAALPCEVSPTDPVLGNRVRVTVPDGARSFTLRHRTAPEPAALGFAAECVYALCQPIQARTLVPIPDSPRARLRISVEAEVPAGWRALVSSGEEIPSYLLALTAGVLESRELSARTRVHAHPSVIEAAVRALGFVEPLMANAERLFGAYPWPRFDLAVMPPSFPYGGMEGPSAALLSPTVLDDPADARRVIAHELAHAWFGNLVTAASAEHLWLNEGWCVWAERRLLDDETVWARGWRDLQALVAELDPDRTRLYRPLAGVAPDEAASMVPYEKGALLIRRLEQSVGAARFDAFTRAYLERFRLRAVDTDELRAFTDEALPGHGVDLARWLHGEGIPADAPAPRAPAPPPDELPVEHAAELVQRIGRLQIVRPLWLALARTDPARAASLFRKVERTYHPLGRALVETLLRRAGVATREVNPLGLRRR